MNVTLRLADPKLTAESYATALTAWSYGNHSLHKGFPPGCCDELSCKCSLNHLPLGTLLHRSDRPEELAVYQTRDGVVVAVADVDGPWAVVVDLEVPKPALVRGEHIEVVRASESGPAGDAIVERVTDDVVYVRFEREFPVGFDQIRQIAS